MTKEEKIEKVLKVHTRLKKKENREVQIFYGFCFMLLFICSISLIVLHRNLNISKKAVLGAKSTINTNNTSVQETFHSLHALLPSTTIETSPLQTLNQASSPANINILKSIGNVASGESVSESIVTSSNAICVPDLSYINNSKVQLPSLTANNQGQVNWKWILEPNAPKGNWVMSIVCSKNNQSVMITDKNFTIQ